MRALLESQVSLERPVGLEPRGLWVDLVQQDSKEQKEKREMKALLESLDFLDLRAFHSWRAMG